MLQLRPGTVKYINVKQIITVMRPPWYPHPSPCPLIDPQTVLPALPRAGRRGADVGTGSSLRWGKGRVDNPPGFAQGWGVLLDMGLLAIKLRKSSRRIGMSDHVTSARRDHHSEVKETELVDTRLYHCPGSVLVPYRFHLMMRLAFDSWSLESITPTS